MQLKHYKLVKEAEKVWLYWVTFDKLNDGSFQVGRGRDLMKNWDHGVEVCQTMAEPSTEEEYTAILRRYLRTDQRALELVDSPKNSE